MLYQAAVACTDAMTEEEIASGRTFPAISRIREISKEVACNVIEVALDENLCTKLSRKDVPTRDARRQQRRGAEDVLPRVRPARRPGVPPERLSDAE